MQYGGNTACVRVDNEGETLIVDAGSGLMQYLAEIEQDIRAGRIIRLEIVLSHLHLDHIIGLSTFSPLWDSKNDICIYTKSRNEMPLAKQVMGVFAPPYWPVDLSEMLCASVIEMDDSGFTSWGGLHVKPFASNHQDGTTVFRITGNKTLVYLLDCEMTDDLMKTPDFLEHCMDADLILLDAGYLPQDYPKKKGWGHSTYEHGVHLAKQANIKYMIAAHLSQRYLDEELRTVDAMLAKENINCKIAFDGMEISL